MQFLAALQEQHEGWSPSLWKVCINQSRWLGIDYVLCLSLQCYFMVN
jgi:hypothetical protein